MYKKEKEKKIMANFEEMGKKIGEGVVERQTLFLKEAQPRVSIGF